LNHDEYNIGILGKPVPYLNAKNQVLGKKNIDAKQALAIETVGYEVFSSTQSSSNVADHITRIPNIKIH